MVFLVEKMITRDDVLSRAVTDCMKELYSLAQPSVDWEEFKKENKIYSERYNEWERNRENHPEWKDKTIIECIGPRPYEFYYLPKEIMKDICDSYVYAYKLDSQQELLDTIEILKNYCKEPIVDKYIEGELRKDGTHWPGHRGYDHPDNLEKEVYRIVYDIIHPISGIGTHFNFEAISKQACNKFFEFLDMAGNFYSWNRDLNSFSMSIYLGASPNSNKEAVIENWKKYRNKDIEIDDSIYKEDEEE